MNQNEIKNEYAAIHKKIKAANNEIRRLQLEIELLQDSCEHPNQYRTSHMGETCLHCPDCGNCP